jgi:hypothetical protein
VSDHLARGERADGAFRATIRLIEGCGTKPEKSVSNAPRHWCPAARRATIVRLQRGTSTASSLSDTLGVAVDSHHREERTVTLEGVRLEMDG